MDRRFTDILNRTVRDRLGELLSDYRRPSTDETIALFKANFSTKVWHRKRDAEGFDVSGYEACLTIEASQLASLDLPEPLQEDTFVADGKTFRLTKVDLGPRGSWSCWCVEVPR